jgi:glycosyltransferase involved in cell wall biosynthesis
MICGRPGEPEEFGVAGEVVPLADPIATANAIARLLLTPGRLAEAAGAARKRVRRYYDKQSLDSAYASLYRSLTLIPASDGRYSPPSGPWPKTSASERKSRLP